MIVATIEEQNFGGQKDSFPGQPYIVPVIIERYCNRCGGMFKFIPGEPDADERILREYQEKKGPTQKEKLQKELAEKLAAGAAKVSDDRMKDVLPHNLQPHAFSGSAIVAGPRDTPNTLRQETGDADLTANTGDGSIATQVAQASTELSRRQT